MSNGDEQQQGEAIKLVSETYVQPKHRVEAAKQPLYLGPLECAMLPINSIQKGLLFALKNPTSPSTTPPPIISILLEKLKNSLSTALVHFYPLAGRFETQNFDNDGDDEKAYCSVYIDCNKGPGARLIHATALNVTTSDILTTHEDDVPVIVASLFDLGEKFVNYDCHRTNRPLLSIQVTQLLDGVFIGFTMSHSVVDGTSFMHFLSFLSQVFNDELGAASSPLRIPVLDYKPWCSGSDGNTTAINFPCPPEVITGRYPNPSVKKRVFHFSSTSLARLKAMANEQCTNMDIAISTFQGLAALVWRSVTVARNLSPDEETACCLTMNARPRLDPPMSDDYFGNFVTRAKVVCQVGELLSHDLGWTAMRLNDEIRAQDSEAICRTWKWVGHLLSERGLLAFREIDKLPNKLIIAGSARFDIYGPDFGLGKPLAARMGFASKEDGKITAHPGCEGGGSVDFDIALKQESMASLVNDPEFMSFVSFPDY